MPLYMLRETATKLTSSFFGLVKGKTSQPDRVLTEQECEEIYAHVEEEAVEKIEELPLDYVHVALKFALNELGFSLTDRTNRKLAVFKAETTQVGMTVRDKSLSTLVTLGSITVTDHYTERSLYPQIVQSVDRLKPLPPGATLASSALATYHSASTSSPLNRQSSTSSTPASPESHVLQVEIHTPPMDASCDVRVAVRAKAPRVVLHEPFLD